MAHAQLSFELSKPVWSAEPGQTIRLSGTLTNTGQDRLSIFGYGWYAPDGFVWDVKSLGTPTYLDPGQSFSGDLLDLQVARAASFGMHDVRFDAGGTDQLTKEDFYASAFANVNVVPEPPAWLMALPLLWVMKRRPRGIGPA